MIQTETKKTEEWWDSNPFTYKSNLGVGKQADQIADLDLAYFDDIDRRYCKQTDGGTQTAGSPVFSKYIDYESLRGKKVLDIATGTGFSAVTFARFGADLTGIDLTNYAVEQTKRNFELHGLKGTVLKMDAQTLEFPDNSFDFVCAHGCLMHMPDTNKAVREIYRVLKPGGKVYAWMYNRGWYYWFGIMFLRGFLLGKLITYKFSLLAMTSRYSDGLIDGGNAHTKFYSHTGFKKLFEQAGFYNPKITVNHTAGEWDAWPMRSLNLGWLVPKSVQRFLSTNFGFGLGCSIVAQKTIE
ncbi:MAG: ubiquinone/menaquinone biosynthesis C-methylase UbiE [Candidatus Paceibacteria bacterium]|jgi:ubiquinone/menaquinone biosynthesis C-methylase UbiE